MVLHVANKKTVPFSGHVAPERLSVCLCLCPVRGSTAVTIDQVGNHGEQLTVIPG